MFQREGDFQGQVNQRLSVTQIPFPTLSFTINYWTEEPDRPQSMGSQRVATAAAVASVVSNSVRPHRRQPTRLPRPWDTPGKNAGVGCHFVLQCMKVKSESEVSQLCPGMGLIPGQGTKIPACCRGLAKKKKD